MRIYLRSPQVAAESYTLAESVKKAEAAHGKQSSDGEAACPGDACGGTVEKERQALREQHNGVRILRTTPAKGAWRAVYATRGEGARAKIEEERINEFAVCEDAEGNRFVSGVRDNGELSVMRDDFVGHFSGKTPRHKIKDAAESFVRTQEMEKGNML